MKKKVLLIVPIIFCILLSLIFSFLAYRRYKVEYIETYVSTHQIMQRNIIKDNDIEKRLVPKEYLNDDVYVDKEDIIGKYVKLSYTIPKGSLFYKTALEDNNKDLANTLLLENQINYDIYTSDVKINTGSLLCNMYVDLYLSINNNEKPISDMFLKDCRITALYDQNNKPIKDFDIDSKVYIVSIAIQADQVAILNKALMIGSVSVINSANPYQSDVRSKIMESSQVLNYLQ